MYTLIEAVLCLLIINLLLLVITCCKIIKLEDWLNPHRTHIAVSQEKNIARALRKIWMQQEQKLVDKIVADPEKFINEQGSNFKG